MEFDVANNTFLAHPVMLSVLIKGQTASGRNTLSSRKTTPGLHKDGNLTYLISQNCLILCFSLKDFPPYKKKSASSCQTVIEIV